VKKLYSFQNAGGSDLIIKLLDDREIFLTIWNFPKKLRGSKIYAFDTEIIMLDRDANIIAIIIVLILNFPNFVHSGFECLAI
jgi:hypothetical protein